MLYDSCMRQISSLLRRETCTRSRCHGHRCFLPLLRPSRSRSRLCGRMMTLVTSAGHTAVRSWMRAPPQRAAQLLARSRFRFGSYLRQTLRKWWITRRRSSRKSRTERRHKDGVTKPTFGVCCRHPGSASWRQADATAKTVFSRSGFPFQAYMRRESLQNREPAMQSWSHGSFRTPTTIA
ncbi:unnamed protein product [Symbiodinium sp. KB8]|nr:unnamed protein product [Symbiodinium sp. KB8]